VYCKVYYARIIIEILSLKCHVLNGICCYLLLKYSDTVNFVIFLHKAWSFGDLNYIWAAVGIMSLKGKFSFANYTNNLASLLPLPLLLSVLEINKLSEHLFACSSFSLPEVSFESCGTETLFDCGMWSESRFTVWQVSVAGNKNCNIVGKLQPSKQTLFESEKLKLSNYRPRQALRAPGGWDFQNF
jgi:hypothetical protein